MSARAAFELTSCGPDEDGLCWLARDGDEEGTILPGASLEEAEARLTAIESLALDREALLVETAPA